MPHQPAIAATISTSFLAFAVNGCYHLYTMQGNSRLQPKLDRLQVFISILWVAPTD